MNSIKIKQGSIDKIKGKSVRYSKGDCLGIDCKNGKKLGLLVSNKFNKYYDLTLIEFYKKSKPTISDFINAKIFGTRFGSWEELTYALNIVMIECKYIDNCPEIEKIDNVLLSDKIVKDGYRYLNTIEELLKYYLDELPKRIDKSATAEKFPDLAFVGKHLIDFKFAIE